MSFGARLLEERRRLGYKQAPFAALVGSDPPKQSLYEHDRRGLRADYLERVAAVGVDVVYVLTGKRRDGDWMGEQGRAMIDAYEGLSDEWKLAVLELVDSLHRLLRR